MSRAPWGRLGVVVTGRPQRALGEAWLGLATRSTFGRLLAIGGGVSSCLTSGPGVMEAEDCGSPGYIGRRAELRLLIG